MKTVTVFRVMALVVLTGAVLAGRAEGAMISIVPGAVAVDVGDPVVLDLVVSGLAADEAVGGVFIRLTGDPNVLDGVAFVTDPDSKMGTTDDLGSGFGPAFLDLVFLAEDYSPANFTTLKALQGTGFRLATISLLAIAPGISPIDFVDLFGGYLSDADGIATLPVTTQNGLICVGTPCQVQVSEPGLWALLGAGLAAAAIRRRDTRP